MKLLRTFLIALLVCLPVLAFAQDAAPSLGDVAGQLLALFSKDPSRTSLGLASGILALLLQVGRLDMMNGIWEKMGSGKKKLVVLVIGQAYGIVQAIVGGASFMDAAIDGLFVSGGAVAVYAAIKGLKQLANKA